VTFSFFTADARHGAARRLRNPALLIRTDAGRRSGRGRVSDATRCGHRGGDRMGAGLGTPSFEAKLAARLDLYGKVDLTRLGPGDFDIGPADSADAVVTFRNLHNWMSLGPRTTASGVEIARSTRRSARAIDSR
jgi:hypothetical protein